MSKDTESKRQVIRNLFEHGWNQEQYTSFAEYIAERVVFNFRGAEQITNLAELKSLVGFWRAAFPDLTFQVLNIVIEHDHAAANLRFTGTHSGEWQGIPPTGQQINVEEMMFFRFENGQIVELWEVYDEATLIGQIKQDLSKPGS